MRALRTLTCTRAYSAEAAPEQKGVEFRRKLWTRYFKETTADTATPYAKTGIRPNVAAAVDTADHDFIEEPVVAQVHRVLEITKQDPFFVLYEKYLSETDPTKGAALAKKIDAILPVAPMTLEEVKKSYMIPYPFLQEPAADKKH